MISRYSHALAVASQGKRHRLRESMMWEDDEAYYSDPNFLSYEVDLPFKCAATRRCRGARHGPSHGRLRARQCREIEGD